MTTQIAFAWDKDTFTAQDSQLLESIAPHIGAVKIGLQAMTSHPEDETYTVADCVRGFTKDNLGLQVAWDAKLDDIDNTAAAAARNIVGNVVHMLTFHTTMSDSAIRQVVQICQEANTLPLGVTVLTDIGPEECLVRYGGTPEKVVERLVRNAKRLGMRGLVCSPQELSTLSKAGLLDGMTTFIPGIRPTWAQMDGQKRTMTPGEAAKAGAKWIVVGRPILNYPIDMGGPAEGARLIRQEIDEA